jgi:transcriptional regulator with GAF, ATPase, and Fis domain
VLAATNRDLGRALAEGRFREDLYYRLSVFTISIPPLRDRREDIPLLVWSIINRRQVKLGRCIKQVPARVMDALVRYAWPGNVRELENVIDRALVLSTGPVLHVEERLLARPARIPAGATGQPPPTARLDHVDREHILRVLEQHGWQIHGKGHAAEALGLHPNTLRSRMTRLGISRPRREP